MTIIKNVLNIVLYKFLSKILLQTTSPAVDLFMYQHVSSQIIPWTHRADHRGTILNPSSYF